MKIATWNVNSLTVRLPQVLDWLAEQAAAGAPVDVLALQELKLSDEKFPAAACAASQPSTCGSRTVSEFTFQVAIFMVQRV